MWKALRISFDHLNIFLKDFHYLINYVYINIHGDRERELIKLEIKYGIIENWKKNTKKLNTLSFLLKHFQFSKSKNNISN
jgi:hypothetical protein